MIEPGTSVVEQSLHIVARPETVWPYWTQPERICDWWGAPPSSTPDRAVRVS